MAANLQNVRYNFSLLWLPASAIYKSLSYDMHVINATAKFETCLQRNITDSHKQYLDIFNEWFNRSIEVHSLSNMRKYELIDSLKCVVFILHIQKRNKDIQVALPMIRLFTS